MGDEHRTNYMTAQLLQSGRYTQNPGREAMLQQQQFGLMANSDQEQGLVILLQTVLVYLLHDQLPNVRQGLCGVLRQQLFQAGQSKLFVPLVGYF